MSQFFPGFAQNQTKIESPDLFREVFLPDCRGEVLARGFRQIVRDLRLKRFDTWDWYALAKRADELTITQQEIKELLAVEYLKERWKQAGVVPYPHQLETARRVIFDMQGQAILADEVGLGKTIEAGLILKEYLLRGLVKKVLIHPRQPALAVVPRALRKIRHQPRHPAYRMGLELLRHPDCVLDTAKREPHASHILGIPYDLLIIDEAHKLKTAPP